MQDTLKQIASAKLGITTLTTRGSDRLDFHDLHVGLIREALKAAFEAGQKAEKRVKATKA